jgi:anaerobic magnesium-protoporphyrin IX monomethyl ester cyclase
MAVKRVTACPYPHNMKIALLSPGPLYPQILGYGVRILSACLKRIGCEVTVVFLPRLAGEIYSEAVLTQLVELTRDADLIGISLMTDDLENAILMTSALRVHANTPIIWGGIHPTIDPAACLQYADIVCLGEGEETLTQLVCQMRANEDFRYVPGTWSRNGDAIIRNPLRPLVQDLDALPFPDYDLAGHFMLYEGQIRPMTEELLRIAFGFYIITLTTRGCPFQCTYCWNHFYRRMFPESPVVRRRSIENVMSELRWLQERFPYVERLTLDDDAFFVRPLTEIREFAEKYRADIHMHLWITGASPTTLTREKLALLTDAGRLSLRMGIQTGSPRIQKLYLRKQTNEDVLRAVSLIQEFRHKIQQVFFDVIVDNPWETDKETIQTLRLLSRIQTPYTLFIFPLALYPGTDLYEKALHEGILPLEESDRKRIAHHQLRPTYLNHLLQVISIHAAYNQRIPTTIMVLLTNRLLISTGLARRLCGILEFCLDAILKSRFIRSRLNRSLIGAIRNK